MRILLLLVLLLQLTAQAQEACTLTFSGRVLTDSGEPLAGATIYLRESGKGTISNETGEFMMSQVCPGKYHVVINYLGFEEKTEMIRLTTSSVTELVVLQPANALLEAVIVEEKFQSVSETSSMSALVGKALERTRGKSLGESLRDLPGINTIQTGPAVFKPVIHGVHSQRILILNNGIRQEGQQWGAEHAPEIDPFIASNIVVIKDATAIKYGTNALGGVVIVNPNELPRSAGVGGEFTSIIQSNGRSGVVSGMLEGGLKSLNGFGWRVQGTARKSGDFHAPDYNLSNTGVQELNFSSAFGLHRDHFGAEVFFSHFQTTLGILRGSSTSSLEDLQNAFEHEPPQYTKPFTYTIQAPRQEVRHDLLKITAHRHALVGEWRFQYGLQINKREEFAVRRTSLKEIPSINLELFTHTLDVELEHLLFKKVHGSIGVNGMIQVNNNIPGTQRIPFIPDYNNASAGVYLAEKLVTGKWMIDAGLRSDFRYYDITGFDSKNVLYSEHMHFSNLSGTVGLSRSIRKKAKIMTTIGSTWRPPQVVELYSSGTHQSAGAIEYGLLLDEETEVLSISEVDFKNERALKWVGSYQFNGNRFQGEATGYVNYIFNYLYLRPSGITESVSGIYPYFRYTQTNASFLGMDISLQYQILKEFEVNANASFLRATDESNNDYLVFVPANRIGLGFRYEITDFTVAYKPYFEVFAKYVMKQNRAPRVVTISAIEEAYKAGVDLFENDTRNFDFLAAPEGYMTINFSLGVSVKLKFTKVDFRFSADNLFDTAYREYTNRLRYYADDIGRNFTLAVKASF